jgi:hypothetical protein
MNTALKAISIIAISATSASAQATDWWWVSGRPGADNVYFVDAESVVKNGNKVTFVQASFKRSGETKYAVLTMNCDLPQRDADVDALRDFACASQDIRMQNALSLGGTEPRQLAVTIFSMPDS